MAGDIKIKIKKNYMHISLCLLIRIQLLPETSFVPKQKYSSLFEILDFT